jgi:polysaccharide export outer membrane protein
MTRLKPYLIAIVILLVGCTTSPPADPPAISADTLQPGDTVKITVFKQDQLDTEQVIDQDGNVTLLLVGRVKIAGLTPPQAEAALRNRLNGRFVIDPSVTVAVTKHLPVYVLGEVAKPGAYDWGNDMLVINAVALAGGYTYRARTGDLEVRRSRDKKHREVPATETTRLNPGDVVIVPERWF